MVVEEVCGLLAVSEQQHTHHTIQGEDGGALCACRVRHIERSESILADLKGEAKSLSHSGSGARDQSAQFLWKVPWTQLSAHWAVCSSEDAQRQCKANSFTHGTGWAVKTLFIRKTKKQTTHQQVRPPLNTKLCRC